jgi:uncharacterized protein
MTNGVSAGDPHLGNPWPYQALDADVLHSRGWRPTALREFVLKVQQRCNLSCDYCYMYTMADQSWRSAPATMSAPVWQATAERIAEHATRHGLDAIQVILHGGEPLLTGPDLLVAIAGAVRRALGPGVSAAISTQTNGILLDEPALRRLLEHDIRVGVSLDGGPADNDRHRRHADGRTSFAEVHRALRLLGEPRFRPVFGGVLCTIDADTDPVACYEALLEYRPPVMDFLFRHANWMSPPRPGRRPGAAPVGDWLVGLFDRWYTAPRQETRIRIFEEILNLVLGGSSRSEQVGLSPVATVVIGSDGAIEQVDSLKSAYSGAAWTGLSVLTDTFDAALRHPGVIARQIGRAALCESCLGCDIHQICGGGHYAHRYDARTGFRNRSVYCADLQRIIGHVQQRVSADLVRAGR